MNIVQLADDDRKDVFVKLRDGDVLVDEMVKETVRELNMRNDEKNLSYGRWRAYVTLGVLLLANLLNYIDRYTLAGTVASLFLLMFFFFSMFVLIESEDGNNHNVGLKAKYGRLTQGLSQAFCLKKCYFSGVICKRVRQTSADA